MEFVKKKIFTVSRHLFGKNSDGFGTGKEMEHPRMMFTSLHHGITCSSHSEQTPDSNVLFSNILFLKLNTPNSSTTNSTTAAISFDKLIVSAEVMVPGSRSRGSLFGIIYPRRTPIFIVNAESH